jgi:hypothetical protein
MKIIGTIFLIALLAGCGGGGGDSGAPSVQYDMWDYVISAATITKSIDVYETTSNYAPVSGPEIDKGQLRETVMSSITAKYEEIINGAVTTTVILIAGLDTIQAVGEQGAVKRYPSIGDQVGNCTLVSHMEHYSPLPSYNYEDVIELDCGTWSEFYAKGIGKVVGQNHDIVIIGNITTHYYSIGLANLPEN